MKIEIGKYTIYGDGMNLYITEKRAGKDGKETEPKVAGYCGSFEQLLESFAKKKAMRSDAESVNQLLEDLTAIQNETFEIARGIVEGVRNEQ